MRISDWSSDVCSSDLCGHYQCTDRNRADLDDVSAARARALRGTVQSICRQACAGAVAGTELAHRADADVRARRDLPARQPGIYDRRHPYRSRAVHRDGAGVEPARSEEHTSELQSLMRTSYAVFCLKKKN